MNEEQIFKKNSFVSTLFYITGCVFLLTLILKIFMGKQPLFDLLMAILMIIYGKVFGGADYCSITGLEIKVIAPVKQFSKTYKWSDVSEIKNLNNSKFVFITKNNDSFTLNSFFIDKADRERFVTAIKKVQLDLVAR